MWVLESNTIFCFFKGESRVADEMLARAPHDIGMLAIALYELKVSFV